MARHFYLIKVVAFKHETPKKVKLIYSQGIVAWGEGETVKKAFKAAQEVAWEKYAQKHLQPKQ